MEEDDMEPVWPNDVQHPLQTHLILTNLFQLCNPELLLKIRLVCKQWRDLSLPMCRSTLPIIVSKFGSDIVLGPISHRVYPELFYHLKDFVRDYVNNPQIQSDQFPYSAIKLLRWYYDSHQYFQGAVWDAVRNKVTTLEIDDCSIPHCEEFRKLVYETFPNLKTLLLLDCQYSDIVRRLENMEYVEPAYGQHHHLKSLTFTTPDCSGRNLLPVTWLELFSHFPALTHFSFRVGNSSFISSGMELDEEGMEELHQVFQAIALVREHDGRKLPFKSFNLPPALDIIPTREKVELLGKIDLPMEDLKLRLYLFPDMEEELVNDILSVFAEHLWELLVTPKNSSLGLQYCRLYYDGKDLNNLRFIKLSNVLCETMEFLKYTPNLEKIMITHGRMNTFYEPNYWNITRMVSGSVLPDDLKLLRLTSFRCEHLLGVNDVKKLVKWMPNMERLSMFLSNIQFETVCKHWRGLKYLEVYGKHLTNEGLTGRWGQNEEPKPNITYLKQLKMFTALRFVISEESVYHGFLHLPLLRGLKIMEPTTISEEAKEELLLRKGIRLTGRGWEWGPPKPQLKYPRYLERNWY